MLFKQTMRQLQSESEYGGLFVFGKKKYRYTLIFLVAPPSQMSQEAEKRKRLGQNLRSVEVKRELFALTITRSDGTSLDLADNATYGILVDLAIDMAANISVLVRNCNELFENVTIEKSRENTIREQKLPHFLRKELGVKTAIRPKKRKTGKR